MAKETKRVSRKYKTSDDGNNSYPCDDRAFCNNGDLGCKGIFK